MSLDNQNEVLEGDEYAQEYYRSPKGYTWTTFGKADQGLIDKCHEKGVNKSFEYGKDERGESWWWRWSKYKDNDNIFKNTKEEHEAFVAQYKNKPKAQTNLSPPPKDLPPASLRPGVTDNPVTDSPYGFPQYIFVALKGLTDTDGLDSVKTWRQAGWIEDEYTTLHSPKGLGVRMMKK